MTRRMSSYEGDGQYAICDDTVGRKIHTVGNAPSDVIRSMAAIVLAMGSMPAMISPETAPRGRRDAQYSIAPKKMFWPSVLAFPGHTVANQPGSSSSRQNEKWLTPRSISRSYRVKSR